ncbi:MAG: hypothetical protein ABH876_02235 [Patescibacteria group bacterium]|nr:hypothetical protein [Patescibacteria group bacterium]MBU1876849.1 hypothetical protein [Patescibacteria group bacterium]
MAKKIFDILPPQEVEKAEVIKKTKEIKKEEAPLPLVVNEEEIDSEGNDYDLLEKISFKPGPILLVLALISLSVFGYFYLAKALIIIYPITELSSLETDMIIDQGINSTSASAIPGRIYTSEKTISKEFSSSGTALKESKAEGIIRIYNAYSTSPQSLVVNTRFISTEGKLFRIKKGVTVPGGHYEGQELIPGFIDVEVGADQSGEEFNIKSSTFSIPGFAGTPRYTYFYGKSFQAMTGGFKKEVNQVTQKDLDNAQTALEQQVIAECLAGLKGEIASETDLVLLDKAVQTKIVNTSFSATVNKETERFTVTSNAKSTALVFNSRDEKIFVINFASSQAPDGKKLNQNSLDIERSLNKIDLESGKIIFSLNIDVEFYSDIDLSVLGQALKGKSLDEAKICLENYPQIDKSSISLWPFWVKKVPQKEEKVKIELQLD